MNRILSAVLSLVLVSAAALADDNRPHGRQPVAARHYVVTTAHVLQPDEQEQLAADGIEVQHVLPERHYLVRVTDASALIANPNIRAIEPYGVAHKVGPLARRAAMSARPFVTLNVRFHDDVTVEQARDAVEAVGGTIDTLLPLDAQRLRVTIPPSKVGALAANESVFGIYGPPLKAARLNSVAAAQAHVTPLYTAPYNLDGTGVVLSMHEPSSDCDSNGNNCDSAVDATHPEFSGRVTLHDPDKVADHGTHVAGTMIAKGIDPLAKGMAPNATLQMFNVSGDDASIADKGNTLPGLNVTGNNNSWGFELGWQQESSGWVWYGATDYFGGYDGFYSAPYDKVATISAPGVLFVHSAGNDGADGNPSLGPSSQHRHVDDNFNTVTNEQFCYSTDGSGKDCPANICTPGISSVVHDDNGDPVPHCEIVKHPTYGPFNTMSFIAAEKNVVAVGAINALGGIAGFSSRGPARDGRVKPDLVADGVNQYSTIPNGHYSGQFSGTSMSSPVVTGISALVVQQWRQTFGGQTPTAQQVKTLLIAGADDIGNPGPDYTFGFGLVDAQASVDLIRTDNNTSARIRTATIAQGQTVDVPMTLATAQNVRVVVGWADPPVVLGPNDVAGKTLVNDIDLKVVDPSGNTVLPYVLDPNNVDAVATHGVNNTDNTEEVEVANAQPGVYHVQLTGTHIAVNSPQTYVLVANGALGVSAPPCGDVYEPNDTPATAYSFVLNGQRITARLCSASDLDYYNIQVPASGPLSISVTATDTPIKVTLSGNGMTPIVVTLAAGQTQTLSTNATPGIYTVKVEANGTVGSDAHYTFTPTFTVTLPPHTRRAGH